MLKIKSKGELRLLQELDMIWLIKQVRNSKLIFNYLLTQKERLLLRFNNQHVINSETSEDNDNSELASDSDLLSQL